MLPNYVRAAIQIGGAQIFIGTVNAYQEVTSGVAIASQT
jgi:hypothetical protein